VRCFESLNRIRRVRCNEIHLIWSWFASGDFPRIYKRELSEDAFYGKSYGSVFGRVIAFSQTDTEIMPIVKGLNYNGHCDSACLSRDNGTHHSLVVI